MPATITHTLPVSDASVRKIAWEGLGDDENGVAAAFPEWSDRSVQINGTFGGATVVIEGSNDGGSTWVTLTDPQGSGISTGSEILVAIQEVTGLIRPASSGGSGSDIDIWMVVRRPQFLRV